MFLSDQNEHYLEFKNVNALPKNYRGINSAEKNKVVTEVLNNTNKIKMFLVHNGDVYLKHTNSIYCLEFMPESCDIVLPSKPQRLDWVVLHYEPGTVADQFKLHDMRSSFQKWVIRSNDERIMGLDEKLICDMPFISLRLTYIDKIDGWVVT